MSDAPRQRFAADSGGRLKVLEATGPPPTVGPPSGRRVVVIGAGVAGLTAAHELADRGFTVTVYERKALGGKARSIPVANSATGGRRELPGEHGCRFVPGFYQHLPDTMARIQSLDDARSVWNHTIPQSAFLYARSGDRENPIVPLHLKPMFSCDFLRRAATTMSQQWKALPPKQLALFATRLLVFMTSSDERRFGQWEYTSWWDFARAGRMGDEYRKLLVHGVTEHLIAARADLASARAIGTIGEAFVYAAMRLSTNGEIGRVLDAPTTESWIDPWVAQLRSKGVKFVVGVAAQTFEMNRGRVTAARVTGPAGDHRIEADWYICAVPVERARMLMTDDILAADRELANLSRLRTEWMNGIQFYLRRPVSLVDGPVAYVDSPWGLVSASQAQWWKRDLSSGYGDGDVRDCLSVNIGNFDAPGIVYDKPASKCTPAQIATEVLAQIRVALEDSSRTVLPDDVIDSWFLDPALGFDNGAATNDEPLFVHYTGSWDMRPSATTAIPNFFLAGDYVRENLSAATMEGANQTGRLAANGVLEASGSNASPSRIFSLYDPPALAALKRNDADRFRRGLPHLLDRT